MVAHSSAVSHIASAGVTADLPVAIGIVASLLDYQVPNQRHNQVAVGSVPASTVDPDLLSSRLTTKP